MVDLYEKEDADVVTTPPEREETIPAKEESNAPVEEPKEDVQPVARVIPEELMVEKPFAKESDEPAERTGYVTHDIPAEPAATITETVETIEEEKVIETKEHDDVEFVIDEIGFNIESMEIPSFDYGYKNPMTKENLEVDMGKLFTGAKPRSSNPTVFMIPGSTRSIMERLIQYPNPVITDDEPPSSEKEFEWASNYFYGMAQSAVVYDQYRYLVNNQKARWKNGTPLANGKLRGIRSPQPTLDKAKTNTNAAVALLHSTMNVGKDVDVFLYHSGFSVTLAAPTLSQFMALDRKISENNIEIGRKTMGLLHSADTLYAQKAIMDLFFDCVKDTSLGVVTREDLINSISQLDLPTIAWALACAKYPNGYNLAMSCMAKPSECHHQWFSVINPRLMFFVDNDKLSAEQIRIAGITRRQSQADFVRYWDEFDFGEERSIELPSMNENIQVRITFGNPPIGHYFRSAEIWINEIVRQANESFKLPLEGQDRAAYIQSQVMSTKALTYAHFVQSIVMTDVETGDEVEVTDEKEIRGTLIALSGHEHILNHFLNGVQRFINRATIVAIAIPNIRCPSCGGFHDTDDEGEVNLHIVPVDPIVVFIILCQQQTHSYRREAEDLVKPKTPINGETTSNEEER